ncbi:hypothetical protein OG21DRAFT_1573935 [Imleria badia]|nr:hypothetical protein OG21DRAFT_1573935 [Imleria badia]
MAAAVVMILRLWAMYNRSKIILRIFLSLFALELISSLLGAAIYSDARIFSDTIHISICAWKNHLPSVAIVVFILQMTHSAAMCIFAIAQFVRQSLEMYRMTKQWQFSYYMKFLVKQGILYFFYILNGFNISPIVGWQLSGILQYVPMYVLTPRFILSIRELYARDVQGRRGEGIDTGFGLLSSGRGAGTAIVFADIEGNEGLEDDVWGRRGDGVDTGFGLSSSGHGAVGDGDGTRGC